MKEIPYFHTINVRKLPATDTRGARIVITCDLVEGKRIIPYDYAQNNIVDGARAFLERECVTIDAETESSLLVMPRQGLCQKLERAFNK
jgi:hypothetical protein